MARNYQNIEDFLQDESFLNFVRGKSSQDQIFWKKWLADHPESRDLAEDARLLVTGISFVRKEPNKEEILGNLARLEKELAIDQVILQKQLIPKKIHFFQNSLFKWVASISLLLSLSFWMYQNFTTPELITWTTGYGERQKIILEDGSEILLNANSQISYLSTIQEEEKKVIQLRGEAYFDIEKQTPGTFYFIKAGDMTAQVLGTSFNINVRQEQAVLSLDEGKLSLIHSRGSTREMEEGKTAQFDEAKNTFAFVESRNRYWNSWTEEVWIFDEAESFEKVLERIKSNYGLDWKVEDPTLLERRLQGSISIESLDILLESISFILDIECKRVGKTKLLIK